MTPRPVSSEHRIHPGRGRRYCQRETEQERCFVNPSKLIVSLQRGYTVWHATCKSRIVESAHRSRLLGSVWQWGAIGVCLTLGLVLFNFVDLTPKVQPDFFFSNEDPQLQSSVRIEKE